METEIEKVARRREIGVCASTPGTEDPGDEINAADEAAIGLLDFYLKVNPWLPRLTWALRRLHDVEGPWVTQEGVEIPIDEIVPEHAANILRRWERRGPKWKERLVETATIELELIDVGPGGPSGDAASLAFEHEIADMAAADPVEFFESLPLVKRMREIASAAAAGR